MKWFNQRSKGKARLALTAGMVLAFAFNLSCTADIESSEDILNRMRSSSSSEQGVSSSSSPLSGLSSSSEEEIYSSAEEIPPPPSSSSVAFSSSSIISGGKGNDINNYKTVVIGTQIWMAENLDYAVDGSKCYSNQESYCNTYGRLYNWATAMGFESSCNGSTCSSQIQHPHRGICPSGWHIPSNTDWDKLYRFADGTSGTSSPYGSLTAGTKLKSQTGWNSYSGAAGTDQYGFSALPGGYGGSDGSFYDVGDVGGWWSASENNSDLAYGRYIYFYYANAYWSNDYKSNLFSVRCLQD